MARFSIGWTLEPFSLLQASATCFPVPESRPGSYEGLLTSARILPVDGSIAATAPLLLLRPLNAACCIEGLMVVTTLPPGCCVRLRLFQYGIRVSSRDAPERMESSAFSRSVVP